VLDPFAPLLARIDDRLIHGQVVVGCCEPLGAESIVLIDDGVAGDSLQQKLYRAAAPPSVAVCFVRVDDAHAVLEEMAGAGRLERAVVVVARARTLEALLVAGVRFDRIQVGGAHAREGAPEIVPGLFLDREDREALRAALDAGVEVFIQPVAAAASQALRPSMLGGESA
jgi:mannose/fructose/N-acetylgalactosamine-specific phosphotransferase system component IIB